MLAFIILALGIFGRLVFHAPNFTPVVALALFGGVYLKKKYALIVPVALMMITDMMIGLHDIILFTWGSLLLTAAIGLWLRHNRRPAFMAGAGLLSAVLFFAITNFGAWLVMYPHTWEGFLSCYVAAISFFRNTLLSTFVFGFILFGLYETTAASVKNTRLANVFLNT